MLSDSPLGEFFNKLQALEQGPLLGRIEELRSRIIRCLAIVFGVFVLCFAFAADILRFLEQPLVQALPAGANVLHFTGPMEVFVAYVQVSFMIALCISLPILLMQIWAFVKPALPAVDQGLVVPFFVAALLLFAGGVAFCFYVMMPTALRFLIEMGREVATPTIMVSDFVSLATFMLLGFGASFELPLAIVLLERLGVLPLTALTGNRRYVIVAIVTIAAIVTPTPDPFSQMALATPMYLMFEAAILVIKARHRRDRAKSAS